MEFYRCLLCFDVGARGTTSFLWFRTAAVYVAFIITVLEELEKKTLEVLAK